MWSGIALHSKASWQFAVGGWQKIQSDAPYEKELQKFSRLAESQNTL